MDGSFIPVHAVGHDVIEVFSGDKSIFVKVGLAESSLDFLVGQVLSQVLSNLLELGPGEFALNKR